MELLCFSEYRKNDSIFRTIGNLLKDLDEGSKGEDVDLHGRRKEKQLTQLINDSLDIALEAYLRSGSSSLLENNWKF